MFFLRLKCHLLGGAIIFANCRFFQDAHEEKKEFAECDNKELNLDVEISVLELKFHLEI